MSVEAALGGHVAPCEVPEVSFSSQSSRLNFSGQKGVFCSLTNCTFQSLIWRGQVCEWWRGSFKEKPTLLKVDWVKGGKVRLGRCLFVYGRTPFSKTWLLSTRCLIPSCLSECLMGLWGSICGVCFTRRVWSFPHTLWSASLERDSSLSRMELTTRKEGVLLKIDWNRCLGWHVLSVLKWVSECLRKLLVEWILAG